MKKDADITYYDPDRIIGYKIKDTWFEAINMAMPVFMDPDVQEIYRMCLLDWNAYQARFVRAKYPMNKKEVLERRVKALITKYNPERDSK